MNRMLRRGALIAAAVLLLLMAASMAMGKGVLLDGKVRVGDTVTVPANEAWHGDIYLLGGRVTVNGTVDGDLVALGGQVEVNGHVTGDVLVAGGNVSIGGVVDGDLRIAGGQVNVAGSVGKDLAATGGQVTIPSGGSIGGDLIATSGQLTVAGSVAGSIEAAAGSYGRSGSLGGTEHVVIPSETRPVVVGEPLFDAVRQFLVVVLFGALLLWWLPRVMGAADQVLRTRPLLALGGGAIALVGYIVFVILAFILLVLLALLFGLLRIGPLVAIDVIGGLLGIGVVTFLFILTCAFLTDALIGLALAHVALRRASQNRWEQLGLLAAGAAGVVIITSIPVLGGWVKFAVILFGIGALTIAGWEAWRAGRKPPTPMPDAAA